MTGYINGDCDAPHHDNEDGDDKKSYTYAHHHAPTVAHVNTVLHQLQQQQKPWLIQPVLYIAKSTAHRISNNEMHLL